MISLYGNLNLNSRQCVHFSRATLQDVHMSMGIVILFARIMTPSRSEQARIRKVLLPIQCQLVLEAVQIKATGFCFGLRTGACWILWEVTLEGECITQGYQGSDLLKVLCPQGHIQIRMATFTSRSDFLSAANLVGRSWMQVQCPDKP